MMKMEDNYKTRAVWSCIVLIVMILQQFYCLDVTIGLPTSVGFYERSCPEAEAIVKSTVQVHTQADITIPAGLLRLHFHDCFVQGCDGSVLIDGPNAEKIAITNLGLRGFEVIENAKSKLEATCPGVVSCADILALAARDAVELSGGPSWDVPLGRRDGRVSSASDASNLPSPLDSILTLKLKFAAKGLSVEDLVLLSGAHTIGQTECRFFSYRLYNYSLTGQSDPSMDNEFVQEMKGVCPRGGNGLNKVALDKGSQTTFDTSYFNNIINGHGVLESDQKLMSDDKTSGYVQQYAQTKKSNGGLIGGIVGGLIGGLLGGGSSKGSSFGDAFSNSMVKMGNIQVLIGNQGEIRKVCSSFN